jgi:hypothetical protein
MHKTKKNSILIGQVLATILTLVVAALLMGAAWLAPSIDAAGALACAAVALVATSCALLVIWINDWR